MRGWKLLIIAWVFLGAVSLIVGVPRITFACLWVLYLMELMANYRGEKGDQTDEILKELESAASDARRDMGIDDTEKDAIYDDGRQQGLMEAAAIIRKMTGNQ